MFSNKNCHNVSLATIDPRLKNSKCTTSNFKSRAMKLTLLSDKSIYKFSMQKNHKAEKLNVHVRRSFYYNCWLRPSDESLINKEIDRLSGRLASNITFVNAEPTSSRHRLADNWESSRSRLTHISNADLLRPNKINHYFRSSNRTTTWARRLLKRNVMGISSLITRIRSFSSHICKEKKVKTVQKSKTSINFQTGSLSTGACCPTPLKSPKFTILKIVKIIFKTKKIVALLRPENLFVLKNSLRCDSDFGIYFCVRDQKSKGSIITLAAKGSQVKPPLLSDKQYLPFFLVGMGRSFKLGKKISRFSVRVHSSASWDSFAIVENAKLFWVMPWLSHSLAYHNYFVQPFSGIVMSS